MDELAVDVWTSWDELVADAPAELLSYRAGFADATDGLPEMGSGTGYVRGYDAGLRFAEMITATKPYVGEPHFVGWTVDSTLLPPHVRRWVLAGRR
jgi:hypothetical protein